MSEKNSEQRKEEVKSQQREKINLKNKNSEKEKKDEEESNRGFFSKYKWYFVMFIAFQIGSNYFRKNNPNQPKFNGVIEEGTEFDINFYLSNVESINSVKGMTPFYSIKDLKYSYHNYSFNSFNNKVNVAYNISHLLNRKIDKFTGLYLVAEMKLKVDSLKRLQKYHQSKNFDFIRSINILKYVDDLNNLLANSNDLDDINVGREFKQSDSNIPSNAIPKLYYKNNFIFYIVQTAKEEDVTTFQTLSVMRIPLRVDTNKMTYFPIIYLSDFWSMDSELTQINKTENGIVTFNFNLNFNYIKSFFFSNMLGIQFNDQIMYEKFKISGTKDILVELIKNNSKTYLVILFTVNLLHTIFSYLGFSSDIKYYKNIKKLDGVYTKYIFFNIFYMLIAFIYILLKGANFIVKIELFISLVIELWKISKVFKISFTFSQFPYIINIEYKKSFDQEESKDYETEAINLMVKFLLTPIAFIYLIYRIYYFSDVIKKNNFKSIAIFTIEYIYFLLNVFGFILMTPQIYLNYKLKSVEHLPLRAMTYKFLNTIIDDLYAFAVKTPIMYRIFCFKDDVVFVIYIYQIFKYRKNNRAEQLEKEEHKKKVD